MYVLYHNPPRTHRHFHGGCINAIKSKKIIITTSASCMKSPLITCITSSRWLSRAISSDCREQPPVMMMVPQKEPSEASHSWKLSSFRITSSPEHWKQKDKAERWGWMRMQALYVVYTHIHTCKMGQMTGVTAESGSHLIYASTVANWCHMHKDGTSRRLCA